MDDFDLYKAFKGLFDIQFNHNPDLVTIRITNFIVSSGGDMLALFSEDGNIYNFRNINAMYRVGD